MKARDKREKQRRAERDGDALRKNAASGDGTSFASFSFPSCVWLVLVINRAVS